MCHTYINEESGARKLSTSVSGPAFGTSMLDIIEAHVVDLSRLDDAETQRSRELSSHRDDDSSNHPLATHYTQAFLTVCNGVDLIHDLSA